MSVSIRGIFQDINRITESKAQICIKQLIPVLVHLNIVGCSTHHSMAHYFVLIYLQMFMKTWEKKIQTNTNISFQIYYSENLFLLKNLGHLIYNLMLFIAVMILINKKLFLLTMLFGNHLARELNTVFSIPLKGF